MKLTPTQILSISILSEQLPLLFSSALLSFSESATHIDVISRPNAEQKDCQRVLLNIFPNGDFEESHLVDSGDGTFTENLKLVDPSGANIVLYMKREPEKRTPELVVRQEGAEL